MQHLSHTCFLKLWAISALSPISVTSILLSGCKATGPGTRTVMHTKVLFTPSLSNPHSPGGSHNPSISSQYWSIVNQPEGE